ncbi:MAG: adenylyl cyclase, partial [Pseudomonadota bacterium]
MRILDELKRRNVFRVAGVYAVAGWLIAQAAGVLENSLNMPGWFDTVIVSALLLGFPIALILAWAFEMTPEGMKLTANVAEGESIAPKTGRKLDYAIVGGLALVGVMIVADRLMPS